MQRSASYSYQQGISGPVSIMYQNQHYDQRSGLAIGDEAVGNSDSRRPHHEQTQAQPFQQEQRQAQLYLSGRYQAAPPSLQPPIRPSSPARGFMQHVLPKRSSAPPPEEQLLPIHRMSSSSFDSSVRSTGSARQNWSCQKCSYNNVDKYSAKCALCGSIDQEYVVKETSSAKKTRMPGVQQPTMTPTPSPSSLLQPQVQPQIQSQVRCIHSHPPPLEQPLPKPRAPRPIDATESSSLPQVISHPLAPTGSSQSMPPAETPPPSSMAAQIGTTMLAELRRMTTSNRERSQRRTLEDAGDLPPPSRPSLIPIIPEDEETDDALPERSKNENDLAHGGRHHDRNAGRTSVERTSSTSDLSQDTSHYSTAGNSVATAKVSNEESAHLIRSIKRKERQQNRGSSTKKGTSSPKKSAASKGSKKSPKKLDSAKKKSPKRKSKSRSGRSKPPNLPTAIMDITNAMSHGPKDEEQQWQQQQQTPQQIQPMIAHQQQTYQQIQPMVAQPMQLQQPHPLTSSRHRLNSVNSEAIFSTASSGNHSTDANMQSDNSMAQRRPSSNIPSVARPPRDGSERSGRRSHIQQPSPPPRARPQLQQGHDKALSQMSASTTTAASEYTDLEAIEHGQHQQSVEANGMHSNHRNSRMTGMGNGQVGTTNLSDPNHREVKQGFCSTFAESLPWWVYMLLLAMVVAFGIAAGVIGISMAI